MGVGGIARLCRHREPGDVRTVAGCAGRPSCRYPDAGQVWQLPALPVAGDVLLREEGLVVRSALADQTDGGRGDRDHAGRREAMRAATAALGPTWTIRVGSASLLSVYVSEQQSWPASRQWTTCRRW